MKTYGILFSILHHKRNLGVGLKNNLTLKTENLILRQVVQGLAEDNSYFVALLSDLATAVDDEVLPSDMSVAMRQLLDEIKQATLDYDKLIN